MTQPRRNIADDLAAEKEQVARLVAAQDMESKIREYHYSNEGYWFEALYNAQQEIATRSKVTSSEIKTLSDQQFESLKHAYRAPRDNDYITRDYQTKRMNIARSFAPTEIRKCEKDIDRTRKFWVVRGGAGLGIGLVLLGIGLFLMSAVFPISATAIILSGLFGAFLLMGGVILTVAGIMGLVVSYFNNKGYKQDNEDLEFLVQTLQNPNEIIKYTPAQAEELGFNFGSPAIQRSVSEVAPSKQEETAPAQPQTQVAVPATTVGSILSDTSRVKIEESHEEKIRP